MLRAGCFVLASAIILAFVSAASAETNADRIVKILSETIPSCWTVYPLPTGEKPVPFAISVKLTPEGFVDGRPVSTREPASAYQRMMMASGVRAILKCTPFKALATSNIPYEDWKSLTINFDPSKTDF